MSSLRRLPFYVAIVLAVLAVLIEFAGACIGLGLSALATFDLMVLLTTALIAAPLVLGNALVGRTQGVVTLVAAVLILMTGLALLFLAIAALTAMFASLVFPIVYLGWFGGFPKADAQVFLGLAMLCKIGFAICLILAQQRFLENIGLVLIIAMSMGLTLLVSFLHGFPTVFVSITDAVAAIIILILACLRALGFAIAALPAIKKATGI